MDDDRRLSAATRLAGLAQITDNLYLSNASSANSIALVSSAAITCIINVTRAVVNTPIPDVEYVRVPVADSPSSRLGDYFDGVADRIRQVEAGGGRALVHCNAGVSRSAALCLAYLMKHRSMTLLEAHRLLRARRPIVRPNSGFWKQLIDYENKLYACSTVRMILSPLGDIPDVYEKETKNMIAF
ncbi:dual specificity protein phosphatase 18 [Amia ocellicauda]|uniref:dual specificity protein phosphatase 18 n=1 Tax=Amia ocellicauda TaxID=2972642 RepID=UPI003464337C